MTMSTEAISFVPVAAGLMALNHLGSALRDKSRSFPKAEGFNPQGCSYFLDGHQPPTRILREGLKTLAYIGFVHRGTSSAAPAISCGFQPAGGLTSSACPPEEAWVKLGTGGVRESNGQ